MIYRYMGIAEVVKMIDEKITVDGVFLFKLLKKLKCFLIESYQIHVFLLHFCPDLYPLANMYFKVLFISYVRIFTFFDPCF